MQNHRLPSFFLTNTTALYQALWLGLIVPDSQHFLQVVWNLFNQWQGNPSKLFLKGSVICNFYHVFCGVGKSRPLKSNSLNNLPCLCLMDSLGLWESWGHQPPPATALLQGVRARQCCYCSGDQDFLPEGL